MILRHLRRAAMALATLLLAAACSDPTEADLLASAHAHIDKRDRAAATIDLKTLLQAFPASGEGRYLLGTVLFDNGDAAGAEAEFRRAMQAGFDADKVVPRLVATLIVRRANDLVIQDFGQTRLKDDKAAAALQVQLAAAHLAKGRLDDAQRAVTEALQRQPGQADALAMRARLLAARGQPAEAMAEIDELLKRSPDNAPAWLLKGNLLLRDAGSAAAATEALRRALALQPAMAPAHEALITLLLTRGDDAAATAQWEAMKKVHPGLPQTRYFEAVLALQKGDGQRALEIAQWLLRGAPDDPALLLMAGRAELLLNSLVKAEALLGKAVAIDPKSASPRRSLAEVQLRSGQAAKALATLKPLLEAKLDDADVLTVAAEAQLQAGDIAAASTLLAQAQRLRPGDARVLTVLALTHLRQGRTESAFNELEALTKASPDTQADLALIQARLQRQEFDAALKAVDALAAKRPTLAQADQLRGQIALRRGDRAAARTSFEAAVGKEANNLQALSSLAALDLADGKASAARARMEGLVQRQPGNARARLALAEVVMRAGAARTEVVDLLEAAVKAQPADVEPRLALVDYLLGTDDSKAALTAAQNAVAALPNQAELLDRLGRAQLGSGDFRQAAGTFNRLAGLQPKSAVPQLRLAEAQLAGKDLSAAAASVRRALQLEPQSPATLQAGVAMALREKQPDRARSLARTAQTLLPEEALGYQLEGEVDLSQQRYDAAATAFQAALGRRNPGSTPMRLHLALKRAGRSTEADRVAASWMKAHPDDAAFPYHLGDLALAELRWDDAEAKFREVIRRQPSHAMALNNLAFVLMQQRKPGAVEVAEQAVKAAPGLPAALDTLALAYAQDSQADKAVEIQARTVKMAPGNPQYRLNLAKFYLQANDTPRARETLEALSALGSAFAGQAEVGQLLKRVGAGN